MFSRLVECIPNFSEGRRPEVIQQIIGSITSVDSIQVLNYSSDFDHNRSVISFVGHPDYIGEAAFKAIEKAKELIDISQHKGEHPRLGVADVCPFVPLKNTTIEECVVIAQTLGKRVSEELDIPVYLYEEAAFCGERKKLENIRRGGFEKLKDTICKDPDLKPDFGSKEVHPTAGAICIGVRFFLIAYNINLNSSDVQIAKKIACSIREKNGGLPGVKALGFSLECRNLVQVSMNLIDYRQTSMKKVFDRVCEEALKYGIDVLESEVVGLVPEDAVLKMNIEELKLTNFKSEQIIENKLRMLMSEELAVTLFLDKLASKSPTPGGGSAAALTGAISAALVMMIVSISLTKKKSKIYSAELMSVQVHLKSSQAHLVKLIQKDSEAYQSFLDVRKMPKNTETEQKKYKEHLDNALVKCVLIPLDIAITCLKVMEQIPTLVEITLKSTISDLGIACSQSFSAIESSILTIKSNLKMIKDESFHEKIVEEMNHLKEKSAELKEKIMQFVEEKL